MTIFSKIIAGEIPCYKIAEDRKLFPFLDIRPLTKGHLCNSQTGRRLHFWPRRCDLKWLNVVCKKWPLLSKVQCPASELVWLSSDLKYRMLTFTWFRSTKNRTWTSETRAPTKFEQNQIHWIVPSWASSFLKVLRTFLTWVQNEWNVLYLSVDNVFLRFFLKTFWIMPLDCHTIIAKKLQPQSKSLFRLKRFYSRHRPFLCKVLQISVAGSFMFVIRLNNVQQTSFSKALVACLVPL